MKKIILVILVVSAFLFFKSSNDNLVIPKEAIRFRVIANSNTEKDQTIKRMVSIRMQQEMSKKLAETSNVDEARNTLKTNVPYFEDVVKNTLGSNNINESFTVNYGMNYFPEKIYNGVQYKEGEYESLVVTLGDGLGDNWWCVLFPPLCLLEAEETEDTNDVEYKFFISELIDKYLK